MLHWAKARAYIPRVAAISVFLAVVPVASALSG